MKNPKDVNILVVDDEEGLRRAIIFDLKRKGFNVLEASNGQEAFALVKQHSLDVVLSDVRMPNGDGIELLEKIKELNPEIPVVMFITGFADISLDEAYDKGADAVFSKPFDRKALLAAIMKAISTKEEVWGVRSAERYDIHLNVQLKCPDLGTARKTKILNIGRGGLFIALDENFPKLESKISFNLTINDTEISAIEGEGIVRWVRSIKTSDRPSGCGIEFQYLSDNSRKRVIALIEKVKSKAFIPKV